MDMTSLTALAESLRAAAKSYYVGTTELMTDAQYDDGIEQLRIAVAEDPALAPQFADLLEQVAAGQSAGGDITHSELMGSMDKATSLDAVTAFVNRVTGGVVVEPKLDGLAVAATYQAGRLVALATRGDGRTGEDVLSRAGRITGLPTTIAETGDLEVRGEVYMSDADFEHTNTARVAAGKAAFVNPRNAVAGALRKENLVHEVRMSFAAYEAIDAPTSHLRRMEKLESLGFAVAYRLLGFADVTAVGPARVRGMIEEFGAARATAGFPTDGVIVKADSAYDRVLLGVGSRSPKWAIAYKYEAETATAVVQDIEVSVGRTGRLALRAKVAPVFVGGTTITYASLHNVSWLAERDIRVGDTVVIKRANDVIPYIESAMLDQRPEGAVRFEAPTVCPQCGQPWNTDTLLWRCESPECSVLGRVVYAAQRDCLDIEGLGTEIATALVEGDHVRDIADLFDLGVVQLTALEVGGRMLGASTAKKLMAEIEKAKSAPYNRVVTALGIRMTGRTMGRRLAAAFPTMGRLRAASVADLAAVDGVGVVKAQVIHEGLVAMGPVIDRLAAAGVNMGTEPTQAAGDLPFTGMTIVVSGSVPGLSRNEVNEFIEVRGGKASGSVSKTTSLLVSEPSSSSKYVKATDLGVRIVTPAEFLQMAGA